MPAVKGTPTKPPVESAEARLRRQLLRETEIARAEEAALLDIAAEPDASAEEGPP